MECVRNHFPEFVEKAMFVIPAQAGNQFIPVCWFPACAGMT
jgi:hypothetical protein